MENLDTKDRKHTYQCEHTRQEKRKQHSGDGNLLQLRRNRIAISNRLSAVEVHKFRKISNEHTFEKPTNETNKRKFFTYNSSLATKNRGEEELHEGLTKNSRGLQMNYACIDGVRPTRPWASSLY